jgi:hypothetical protein
MQLGDAAYCWFVALSHLPASETDDRIFFFLRGAPMEIGFCAFEFSGSLCCWCVCLAALYCVIVCQLLVLLASCV